MFFTHLRNILWTGPMILFSTALMGSLSLVVSLFSSSGRAQHQCARIWSRMLLWASGVTVEVEDLEKIPPGGSFVFVSNHRSYFDIPVILATMPVQLRFFAKKSLFYVPFIGFHMKRAGYLSVNRGNARDSLRSMSEGARAIQEKGISVLLFPEGTRTQGEMAAFKDGAAYIAIKAGVPIVPIGVIGTRDVLASGSWTLRSGKVRVKVGDPVPTLDVLLGDRTRLTQSLQQRVTELVSAPRPRAA